MAYVSKELKAKIAAGLKKVMPKDWKYSLSVKHHSTIVLTISSAPIDLIEANLRDAERKGSSLDVNHYHLGHEYEGYLLTQFEVIRNVMNISNYDRSDIMTDYFDVGYYVSILVGRWDKPFRYTPENSAAPTGTLAWPSLMTNTLQ